MSSAASMLANAALLVVVLGLVPMSLGHALLHALRAAQEHSPGHRLLLGVSIGLAVHLVALSGTSFWLPVHLTAPWLTVAAVAAVLLIPGAPRALARDVALALRAPEALAVVACTVASLIAGVFVLLRGGGTVQGTENADAFHYVATAAWLQSHAFNAPLPDATQSAMREFVERAVTFSHPFSMPRVASEALLAYAASVLGRPPEQLFSLVALGVTVLLGLGTFALLDALVRGWSRPALLLGAVLVGLSPIALFTHANSNFPTLIGATLLCSTVLAWRPRATRATWPQPEIALLLAALACAYPELVPVAGLALLVLAVGSGDMRQRSLHVVGLATTCLLSIVAFGWAWWLGAQSLIVAQHVSAIQGNSYPSLFAGLDAFEGLTAFLTLTPSLPRALPTALDVVAAVSLVAAIAVGLATERQPHRLLALSAPCVVLVSYVFLRDFNYGKFKAVQYLAPFFAACAAAGIVEMVRRKTAQPVLKSPLMLVAFIAAGSWIAASVMLERSAIERSRLAHLGPYHRDIAQAARSVGDTSTLLITDEHSLHDAFWAAYFWEPRPVLMLGGLAGWSSNPLERLSPERLAQVDYVLESPTDVVQSAAGNELLANNRFIIRAVGPVLVVPVGGMSPLEPGFRWMGQELRLLVRAKQALKLRIEISGQFPGDAPDASLVAVENASGRIDVHNGLGSGTLDVPAGEHLVTLRVSRPAASPASLGVSADPRPLTYQIRKLQPVLR